MPEDFIEHIGPIDATTPLGRRGESPLLPERGPAPHSIVGRVSAVHRRHPGGGGGGSTGHLLDVTVGGEAVTEIVVRVPPGVYERLEGKRVVMYIDE